MKVIDRLLLAIKAINVLLCDKISVTLRVTTYIYVTGFAKTCIVHTSTFSTLKIHNICYDHQTGIKLAGMVELLSLYRSSKFRILMIFLSCFMNLRKRKIGCVHVNYAHFPKSGHICSYSHAYGLINAVPISSRPKIMHCKDVISIRLFA